MRSPPGTARRPGPGADSPGSGHPHNLVIEIEDHIRSQQKLLSKIVGLMCPPLFGCRTNFELCRVRGWDKNLPSRLLGALPKRSWIKRLRRLRLEMLIPLWRYAASVSAATRSRWQWTWVGDDSVFKKYSQQLGLVGRWWSGQEHRYTVRRRTTAISCYA